MSEMQPGKTHKEPRVVTGIKLEGGVSEVNESLIKAAVSAAIDAGLENVHQAGILKRSRMLADQRVIDELRASVLTEKGFDVDRFEKIRAQHQTALRRIVEKQKADAVGKSSSVRDSIRQGVDSLRKTVDFLASHSAASSPFVPPFIVLDTAYAIAPSFGIFLSGDNDTVPGDNWASFEFKTRAEPGGTESVHFLFAWQNPSDAYAVINVRTLLALNGSIEADADGGVFPGDRHGRVNLVANLGLIESWNQPPTSPLLQGTESQLATSISADGGGFFDTGDIEYQTVSNPVAGNLYHDLWLIPPHGIATFDVSLNIQYSVSSGGIDVDFTSVPGFQIMCPGVFLVILT